jgi:hypothetical protein
MLGSNRESYNIAMMALKAYLVARARLIKSDVILDRNVLALETETHGH